MCHRETPWWFPAEWRGRPAGRITLTGFGGAGNMEEQSMFPSARPTADHALGFISRRAPAFARLADTNELKPTIHHHRIAQLGSRSDLLTAYTFFVAIDDPRAQCGEVTTMSGLLPLPHELQLCAWVPQWPCHDVPAPQSISEWVGSREVSRLLKHSGRKLLQARSTNSEAADKTWMRIESTDRSDVGGHLLRIVSPGN